MLFNFTMSTFRHILFAMILLESSQIAYSQSIPTADALSSSVKRFDTINATQLRLSNGMTVFLKPTDCEEGEIYVKLAALGGYASLAEKERPSAEIAAQVAWESGMDTMSSDQVSVFLYNNSLDIASRIHPFSRVIQGEGCTSGVEGLLQYIKMIFTSQKFTKEGWEAALSKAKIDLNKLVNDVDYAYETAFVQFNTQDFSGLRPSVDLKKADFETTEQLFRRSFSDPSEFYCVIVGDYDVHAMIALINRHLGSIPPAKISSGLNHPFAAPFPKGVTKGDVKLNGCSGNIVRLTFPLKLDKIIDEKLLPQIAFACQVIETRLGQVITEKMDKSYGVDVSYEFPLYPLLADPWLSIRFRCDESQVPALTRTVIAEIRHLQQDGVSEDEVETMKTLEFSHQEFWLQDNFYWLSMLMNYSLWGWDPEKIIYKNTSIKDLSSQDVTNLINSTISLENYSTFNGIFTLDKMPL
ncbi:MAG: insulinase family protein [Parachlamydiaceae bacterium]